MKIDMQMQMDSENERWGTNFWRYPGQALRSRKEKQYSEASRMIAGASPEQTKAAVEQRLAEDSALAGVGKWSAINI